MKMKISYFLTTLLLLLLVALSFATPTGSSDGCISENNICGEREDCINQRGSYICNCKPGLKREGNNCQVLGRVCEPPSKLVEGLGCLTAVAKRMSWKLAQDNCQRNGGRLLEGFGKEHSMVLRELFPHFKDKAPWVGIRDWQWVTIKTPLDENMWRPGQPDRGDQYCAFFWLASSSSSSYTPGLHDSACSNTVESICQLL